MKPKYDNLSLFLVTLIGATLACSCGKSSDEAGSGKGASPAAEAASKPAPVKSDLPLKKIEITANDQMKFSVEAIEAQAGQPLEVTLINVGSMPKASMGHNWVLLINEADAAKIVEEGFAFAGNDYIPTNMEDHVIARTKILGPGERETVTFNAPSEPGDYEYFCSFPGHYTIGMKGILTVK